jgi:hypothetical protein
VKAGTITGVEYQENEKWHVPEEGPEWAARVLAEMARQARSGRLIVVACNTPLSPGDALISLPDGGARVKKRVSRKEFIANSPEPVSPEDGGRFYYELEIG